MPVCIFAGESPYVSSDLQVNSSSSFNIPSYRMGLVGWLEENEITLLKWFAQSNHPDVNWLYSP